MSLNEKMTALADAVREKAELTDNLTIDEMTAAVSSLVVNGVIVDERTLSVTPTKEQQTFTSSDLGENAYYGSVTVNAIPAEYITTTDATAVSGDILKGKTAYVKGEKVTGTIPDSVLSLVYNNVSMTSGYVKEDLQFKVGEDILPQAPDDPNVYVSVTPDMYGKVFGRGIYLNVPLRILGDSHLLPENIKKGVSIFSVEGTYTGSNYPDEKDVRYGVEFGYPEDLGNGVTRPRYGTFTGDATAVSGDILEGKTAYAMGKEVTGTIPTVTPSREVNVVTVYSGYVPEEKIITIGTAKGAETFTPGTAAITILADTYLTGEQVIRGDGNLTPENIKAGVAIFDVSGTFTSDATATASDIAKDKTAYVNGELVVGTASSGAVSPFWYYSNSQISTNIPPCNSFSVPARGKATEFHTFDGGLWWFSANTPYQYDKTINWTYVYSNSYDVAVAIGDGKLYYVYTSPNHTITSLFPSLNGITQVCGLDWGTLCCTESGELYGGGGNDLTKVRRVEYTRTNSTDPVVYVSVSKILNCYQYHQNFWVITADGSLASGWLDKDSFDYDDGAAYAEIDTQSVANGNPFVNYYPQNVDDYGGDSYTKTYELAFRTDGLWYRQAGTYYDTTDRTTKRYSWNKADDPGLRKYDWLGYCSLYLNENYEGWDEETGQEIYTYNFKEYDVALHVDEQGRLWKIAAKGELIPNQYGGKELKLTGLEITQVGGDADWQCVAPVAVNGVGTPGKFNGVWGQKGGKVVNLKASNSDIVEITWDEYPQPAMGRMVCCDSNNMYFAAEGAIVDLSKAGGTF